MGASHLETDTLSNQDISSALEIGSYTADDDRLVTVQFFADQVAGNGDYTFYCTLQIGGSGSAYRLIPITTAEAASGVTAIGAQSIAIAVRNGDVLKCYLDGLAGDTTTPDTTVRFVEDTTLGALVWSSATRTLTQSAASVTAAVSGSDLSLIRGDEWSFSLTGLGDISSNRSDLYFTVKNRHDDDDDESLVQISEGTGLLYINQAAAGTAGNASITVDDAAAGDITITLEAVESAKLPVRGNLVYDVQVVRSTGIDVQTLTLGTAAITYDVTRATS